MADWDINNTTPSVFNKSAKMEHFLAEIALAGVMVPKPKRKE